MFDLNAYIKDIEKIRINNHYTRIEIAKLMGISYPSYVKIMRGSNLNVSPSTLKKIKSFLDKTNAAPKRME